MKKTLIATAIAGAMSFSVAAQAAPVVYGNIQLAVDVENDNTAGDNGSTIGFKGEQALDNGLTAIYKMEFHAKAGSNGNNDSTTATNGIYGTDQNYIGVQGDFGTVRVGAFDAVPNDFVYDMLVAPEATNGAETAFANIESQQVQYTGEFGGVKVGAAVKLNGKDADDSDKDNAMQIGAQLPAGPATVGVAYDTYKSATGVAASMDMDALTVAGGFETSDVVDSAISASVAFDYGMGSVYGLFTSFDTGSVDGNNTQFGATYNLGEPMYVYAEVASGDMNDEGTVADAKATVVGAVLVF